MSLLRGDYDWRGFGLARLVFVYSCTYVTYSVRGELEILVTTVFIDSDL